MAENVICMNKKMPKEWLKFTKQKRAKGAVLISSDNNVKEFKKNSTSLPNFKKVKVGDHIPF